MTIQSEAQLEKELVEQLKKLGYGYVKLRSEEDLLENLKTQIERHNQVQLSYKEFKEVVNHLSKGSVFEKAKNLRDKFLIKRESGDDIWIEFINQEEWCKNTFQVVQQVEQEGIYKNRYDVTILINGLPLVQIELKRRGLDLKKAFDQINRYQRHSFWANSALYQFVQIFVISNGVNTKYYANNRHQSFKQTFDWADIDNKKFARLKDFTNEFLEPCHLAKMITKYIVLHESDKILMVLRPYQYYATESIVKRVKESNKNGYIWHTTGSGKTLTSFKTSQIITKMDEVYKVVFVVDRRDLDDQTTKEFNSFSKGSIDGTDNTKQLVTQFSDETPLIVTTIQKLNTAISKSHYLKKMDLVRDKKMVFIFDECHRSQFGETHKRIKNYFTNVQMFGFTGTPIFAENSMKNEQGKRTTKELFDECLHKYVITDAIRDENVLKFAIEYVGKYKYKDDSKNKLDIEVEDIDTKELLESEKRLEKIVDYIIANHPRKTHAKYFNAIFAVSSIDTLTKYYDLLKRKKDEGLHDLKIATIFSYGTNEDDADANGFIPEEEIVFNESNSIQNIHSRDKLESYIEDYNEMFGTKYSTRESKSFYNYYRNISKRVKNREIDILLVVNMFLTGFDARSVNTLYVDKNLRYHGLIQAFSRTNRILSIKKSHGNIVSFRNLKKNTDEAVTLFSNKNAIEEVVVEPYEYYVEKFEAALKELKDIAPTVDSIDEFPSEIEELEFVKKYRKLLRLKNTLSTYADFDFENLGIDEQEFEDYKSKYLDIFEKNKTEKEKVSILDDVDFELELVHRDEINVAYILLLLRKLYETEDEQERETRARDIYTIMSGDTDLRSKRELIQKFIEENLPNVSSADIIEDEFHNFWSKQQQKAFEELCDSEGIDKDELKQVISKSLFAEKDPTRTEIAESLKQKPSVLERGPIIDRVLGKIKDYISTFLEGI